MLTILKSRFSALEKDTPRFSTNSEQKTLYFSKCEGEFWYFYDLKPPKITNIWIFCRQKVLLFFSYKTPLLFTAVHSSQLKMIEAIKSE